MKDSFASLVFVGVWILVCAWFFYCLVDAGSGASFLFSLFWVIYSTFMARKNFLDYRDLKILESKDS